jgi:hypothetical protein
MQLKSVNVKPVNEPVATVTLRARKSMRNRIHFFRRQPLTKFAIHDVFQKPVVADTTGPVLSLSRPYFSAPIFLPFPHPWPHIG